MKVYSFLLLIIMMISISLNNDIQAACNSPDCIDTCHEHHYWYDNGTYLYIDPEINEKPGWLVGGCHKLVEKDTKVKINCKVRILNTGSRHCPKDAICTFTPNGLEYFMTVSRTFYECKVKQKPYDDEGPPPPE